MTTFDAPERLPRFERDLREALREEAGLERPDYLSDVLLRSVVARQRPAWTFAERWIPVTVLSTGAVPMPRAPLRILAVATILIVLALAVALVAGSRQHVPAPFGPAANGLVAFAKNGDIYTVDPVTGTVTAIVTGGARDSDPTWSRDGTMLAFLRDAGTVDEQLMVAASDGSGVHSVTPTNPFIFDPNVPAPINHAFSPDGREIAFVAGPDRSRTLWVADLERGGVRQLVSDTNVHEFAWLPPSGDEIVYGVTRENEPGGLYAVDVHSGKVRVIVKPTLGIGVDVPAVSPDGSRIAYSMTDDTVTDRYSYRVHVINSDGSADRVVPMPASATFQDRPIWSNDGTRLVIVRGYAARNQDARLAIVPADGSGFGVETKPQITGCCDTVMAWSPDDSTILVLSEDLAGSLTPQLLVDPSTGASTTASWGGISIPDWQRLAP